MVDPDDITDVVASVLNEPKRHAAATYELVGAGRFIAHDIGHTLSKVLGRNIRVEQIEPEVFVRARYGDRDPGTLPYQLRVGRAIAARYSSDDFVGNPNVLTWLLGRAPTSFEEFVRREHEAFQAARPQPRTGCTWLTSIARDFYMRIPGAVLVLHRPGNFALIQIGQGRLGLLSTRLLGEGDLASTLRFRLLRTASMSCTHGCRQTG